jgi:MFS family permease
MSGQPSSRGSERDSQRFFPAIDRYLIGFVIGQLLTFAFVPLLPLGLAAIALITPLRRSKRRLAILWAIGGVMALIVLGPVITHLIGNTFVETGPPHTAPDN